ncbi:MAG: hypothetical protein N2C14_13795, partial [Planctomycetales bacterium]
LAPKSDLPKFALEFIGMYMVNISEKRSQQQLNMELEFLKDQTVKRGSSVIARWDAETSNRTIKVAFTDPAEGVVTLRVKGARTPINGGQIKGTESWAWKLARVVPVSIWEVRLEPYTSSTTVKTQVVRWSFFNNGKVNDPRGNNTYVLENDGDLKLQFEGSPYVSRTTISRDGRTFEGTMYVRVDGSSTYHKVFGRRIK